MKPLLALLLASLGAMQSACTATPAAAKPAAASHEMQPAVATPQHVWLRQLLGDWTASFEAPTAPGEAPKLIEIKERVRAIGDTWIQGEGHASFDGHPFTSILTLGYDPRQQVFVGSWIDTMNAHLWTYRGTLDAAQRVLTLEAVGPSSGDPTKLAQFRDSIELVAPDHRVLRSSMLGDDGQWTQYMQAEYRRTK